LRNRVVGGLLLGLAVTFLALLVNPPGNTTILAQAWNLWDVQGRVLQLLGCYLGGATGPLLLTALLAGALTACRPLRRRGQENPAEYPFAAILFFLVVGAFLLSQAAVVTLAF
jgi:pheromone shutdown protein TraB